ncbi:MAG: polyhydroxyalkanoic acid system family protein [Candidatus Competibacteraceae bacterium]|nr:polyhydroxyalkanoic acid system family protein [Candidatus Competibacteraceae bacterium]
MSHIAIHRAHRLNPEQVRQATEEFIARLAERYEITYHWQGDSLYFERTGIGGQIDLEPGAIRINARLGFLLAPLKSVLEQEIHQRLDEFFDAPPAAV